MTLEIGKAAFEALEAEARRVRHAGVVSTFADLLLPALRDEPPPRLLDRMEEWHGRAAAYGLTTPRAQERFLGFHLTLLPDFDLHPPVRAFLLRADLNGEQKMTMLITRLKAL